MKDTNQQTDPKSEEDSRRDPKGSLPQIPPLILFPDGEPELDFETEIIRDELAAGADVEEVGIALSGVLAEIVQVETMSESFARKTGTEKIVEAMEERLEVLEERAEALRDLRRELERKSR